MKKIIFLLAIGISLVLSSCNYLDVVPDERSKDADAFKDADATLGYLYSCYSYMVNERVWRQTLGATDEISEPERNEEERTGVLHGLMTANKPIFDYWTPSYKGIRQCYIFLANVDGVPGLSDELKTQYKAEATFLIAYYHWSLLRAYGPIIISDHIMDPASASDASSLAARVPYDECVQWISDMLDKSVEMGLPTTQPDQYLGRATSIIAESVKAQMLITAASPLFNGGDPDNGISSLYGNFKNSDGTQLISSTYDRSKWNKAAQAALAAIKDAEQAGFMLYNQVPTSYGAYPEDNTQRILRYTYIDKYSQEVIWPYATGEVFYGGWQNDCLPSIRNMPGYTSGGGDNPWEYAVPTLNVLDQFYTKNGLPIDKDPSWSYSASYNYPVVASPNDKNFGSNQVSSNVWSYDLNREPRYVAWIASHNSIYEVPNPVGYNSTGSGYKYNGDKNLLLVQFRAKDGQGIASGGSTRTNNYSTTGYLIKKGCSPQTAITTSGYSLSEYPWPLIRLSELYLDYAEALIEGDDGSGSNFATAKAYINKIRKRAGIPDIDVAWSVVPGYSGGVNDKKTLRSIVRQERTIELMFEGKRFWDLRRWGIADKYLSVPIYGLNINASDDSFFQRTQLPYRRVFPTGYWLIPIPIGEIQKNPQLVQNPGY